MASIIDRTVDIVLRTKDRPIFLKRALRSICGQTVARKRVIIVNDGGNPRSVRSVVADFLQSSVSIEIVDNDKSIGRSGALNVGLLNSDSEFFAIHDDDDSWNPHFLGALIIHHDYISARLPSVAATACHLTRIHEIVENDIIIRKFSEVPGPENAPTGLLHITKYLIQSEDLLPIQLLFNRKKIDQVGKFDPAFAVHEDREFLIRFLDSFDISVFPRRLAFHHVRERDAKSTHLNSMHEHALFRESMTLLENRMVRGQMGLKSIDACARNVMLLRDASAGRYHAWTAEQALAKKFRKGR